MAEYAPAKAHVEGVSIEDVPSDAVVGGLLVQICCTPPLNGEPEYITLYSLEAAATLRDALTAFIAFHRSPIVTIGR